MSAAEQNQSPPVDDPDVLVKSRRETRRFIWRWLIVGLLVIVAAVAVSLALRRSQLSMVSDIMLIVMVLCPMTLCLVPLVFVMWVAVGAMNKAHTFSGRQLVRLEKVTRDLSERTSSAGEALSQQSIALNVRFARFEKILSAFDPVDAANNSATTPKEQ